MVCGLLAKHAAVAVLTLVFSGSRVGYRVCIADSPRGWFSLKFKYFTVQRDICHRHLEATKIFAKWHFGKPSGASFWNQGLN